MLWIHVHRRHGKGKYAYKTNWDEEGGKKNMFILQFFIPLSIDPPLSLDLRDKSANKRASIFFLFLLFNHTMFQLQF